MSKLTLFERGNVASIFQETLKDGSEIYNIRIYDLRLNMGGRYVEIPTKGEKHASEIFELLNDCIE